MTPRDLAFLVWRSELGKPYRWGGDNPLAGFDCSGFAIEGLKAAGVFPREGDSTAEGLRHRYAPAPPTALLVGDLVFWPAPNGIMAQHVEVVFCITDDGAVFTIGASGGGSKTINDAVAAATDAYVKIRPIREGWKWPVRPF